MLPIVTKKEPILLADCVKQYQKDWGSCKTQSEIKIFLVEEAIDGKVCDSKLPLYYR